MNPSDASLLMIVSGNEDLCPKASEPHSNSTRHITREPGSVCMAMTGNFEEVMLVQGSQG